jgi:hypothetical protein
MGIDLAIREALGARPEAVALACMDTLSGLLLGLEVQGDVPRGDVELAALSAAQLCSGPLAAQESVEGFDAASDEALVASTEWVHAYARVPTRRDLVVVGLAPGSANLALFREWVRRVAERVGPQA